MFREMESIMEAVRAIRNRRAEMNVPPSRKAKYFIATAMKSTFEAAGVFMQRLASASDVELRTCYKDNEVGTYIHIKGGKILEESSSDGRVGTSFKITNLFYNTPARLKHLSSSYAELSHVIDYVNKIALSYPNIKFTLINNDKVLLNTDGNLRVIVVLESQPVVTNIPL